MRILGPKRKRGGEGGGETPRTEISRTRLEFKGKHGFSIGLVSVLERKKFLFMGGKERRKWTETLDCVRPKGVRKKKGSCSSVVHHSEIFKGDGGEQKRSEAVLEPADLSSLYHA